MSSNPKWPHPADDATERARKIALMYRHHLRTQSAAICDQLDRTAVDYGEGWASPHLVTGDAHDAVTTVEAAEMTGMSKDMIRRWACTPHPDDPEVPLLPRFKRRGRQMTYLRVHVEAALEAYRRSVTRPKSA